MRTFVYRAKFEPGNKRGVVVVSFSDVPEAITEGHGEAEACVNAQEALGLALLSYMARGMTLPRAKARGGVPVTVEPGIAAKLALLEALQTSNISKSELARRLGKDEKEVRRILDPRHATKLGTLTSALRALGRTLVIGVERERARGMPGTTAHLSP